MKQKKYLIQKNQKILELKIKQIHLNILKSIRCSDKNLCDEDNPFMITQKKILFSISNINQEVSQKNEDIIMKDNTIEENSSVYKEENKNIMNKLLIKK